MSASTTVPFSTTLDGVPIDYLALDPPTAKALVDNKARLEGLMGGDGKVATTAVAQQSFTRRSSSSAPTGRASRRCSSSSCSPWSCGGR